MSVTLMNVVVMCVDLSLYNRCGIEVCVSGTITGAILEAV